MAGHKSKVLLILLGLLAVVSLVHGRYEAFEDHDEYTNSDAYDYDGGLHDDLDSFDEFEELDVYRHRGERQLFFGALLKGALVVSKVAFKAAPKVAKFGGKLGKHGKRFAKSKTGKELIRQGSKKVNKYASGQRSSSTSQGRKKGAKHILGSLAGDLLEGGAFDVPARGLKTEVSKTGPPEGSKAGPPGSSKTEPKKENVRVCTFDDNGCEPCTGKPEEGCIDGKKCPLICKWSTVELDKKGKPTIKVGDEVIKPKPIPLSKEVIDSAVKVGPKQPAEGWKKWQEKNAAKVLAKNPEIQKEVLAKHPELKKEVKKEVKKLEVKAAGAEPGKSPEASTDKAAPKKPEEPKKN